MSSINKCDTRRCTRVSREEILNTKQKSQNDSTQTDIFPFSGSVLLDTNFANFHQFSPIFMAYYRPARRDDSENIYILGSNHNFSFANLNRAKMGGGVGGRKVLSGKMPKIHQIPISYTSEHLPMKFRD